MAQLRDTVVQGNLQVTDAISSNEVYIDEKKVGNGRIFYGTCASVTADATKIIDCPSYDNLIVGDMLVVKFDYTNNATASSLKLSIDNGVNTTTAIQIKKLYNASLANLTHKAELRDNAAAIFVYDGTSWLLSNADYYAANTNDSAGYIRQWQSASYMKPSTALYRYQILLPNDDGVHVIPANITSSTTATSKANITTASFSVVKPIEYYSHTATVAAEGDISGSYHWTMRSDIDLRYSFNTGSTLTASQDVYLVAILDSPTTAHLRNPEVTGTNASAQVTGSSGGPITQTLPTEEDGFIYIKLGHAYSAYQIILTVDHPIYYYKNGKLRQYTAQYGTISTVSGNTLSLVDIDSTQVSTYVPSVTIPGSTPVLEWNTGVTLATVNNVDIKAALPSNPWKVYYSSATPTGTIAEGSLWLKPM